jgi:hypothetical protein
MTLNKKKLLLTRVLRQADVQTWSLVLLMNFSNKLKLCTPKPGRTQSPKRLYVTLTATVQNSTDQK